MQVWSSPHAEHGIHNDVHSVYDLWRSLPPADWQHAGPACVPVPLLFQVRQTGTHTVGGF